MTSTRPIPYFLKATLLCFISLPLYASTPQSSHDTLDYVTMPSLDIHGTLAMGYYNVGQAQMPSYPTYTSHYSGVTLGYFFRPNLQLTSSIAMGQTILEAVSALSVTPTASLIGMPINQSTVIGLTGATSTFNLLYQTWTLSAKNPFLGQLEIGKANTKSFQATSTTFSPFRRLRGGYEDVVSTFVNTGNWNYVTMINYFGATNGLIDAPHISYSTPSMAGFTLSTEYVPGAYLTDIGGVNKNAMAITAVYNIETYGIRYNTYISYARNVMNGYPNIATVDNSNMEIDSLVFGNQLNVSAALAYKSIDTSISYGQETNSSTPIATIAQDNNAPFYAHIKPHIKEVTLGYTLDSLYDAQISIMGSYAIAKDYACYLPDKISSSEGSIWGLGLGHFVGNFSTELRYQHYRVAQTGFSAHFSRKYSNNILSLKTMYLF